MYLLLDGMTTRSEVCRGGSVLAGLDHSRIALWSLSRFRELVPHIPSNVECCVHILCSAPHCLHNESK